MIVTHIITRICFDETTNQCAPTCPHWTKDHYETPPICTLFYGQPVDKAIGQCFECQAQVKHLLSEIAQDCRLAIIEEINEALSTTVVPNK